jgi:drug/metabolite transporter (DMT)-like permease
LNLEAVLTATLAWIVFRENTDRRVALGMALIVAGAAVLAGRGESLAAVIGWGAPLIGLACLCWAVDNNLTRKVSASDAAFLAGLKGLVAGVVNTGLALLLRERLPAAAGIAEAMAVGLLGYGVSLVLFVLALRGLGAARTGAYFSTAPFMGAAIAVLAFGEHPSAMFWLAAALMGAGVWLHLQERHEHVHTHLPVTHTHRHVHDEHHQHAHDFDWGSHEPHTHEHAHAVLTHRHPHFPDIHHQHRHDE